MSDDSLEPLITECPDCETRFRVSDAQLGMARGRVRCGVCMKIFIAADHFVLDPEDDPAGEEDASGDEDPDAALDALLAELSATVGEEEAARIFADATAELAEREEGAASGDTTAEPADEEAPPSEQDEAAPPMEQCEPGEPAPSPVPELQAEAEAHAEQAGELPSPDTPEEEAWLGIARAERERTLLTPRSRPRRRYGWLLVALAASAVVVAAQAFWFQLDRWAQEPALRPYYERACAVLGCELPQIRLLDAISARNLAVSLHPEAQGRLRVDAMLVNEAEFEQPFPAIELRFSDREGEALWERRFEPSEYLEGELAGARMMPPRTPVRIAIDTEDPGPEAVNYVMRFR